MKELLPKLVIGPNHPLRTGYLVTSIGPRPQTGKSATIPENKDSSLSEEEKATLAKWKAQYQKDQHEASLEAQSGPKVAGKK